MNIQQMIPRTAELMRKADANNMEPSEKILLLVEHATRMELELTTATNAINDDALAIRIARKCQRYYHAKPNEVCYAQLYNRYAVELKGDGTYRLTSFADRKDWPVFLSALAIVNWKKNKGVK